MENGPYRGLLLPQVPVEWEWDSVTFLEQTCIKAGLLAGHVAGQGSTKGVQVPGGGILRKAIPTVRCVGRN